MFVTGHLLGAELLALLSRKREEFTGSRKRCLKYKFQSKPGALYWDPAKVPDMPLLCLVSALCSTGRALVSIAVSLHRYAKLSSGAGLNHCFGNEPA